MEARQRKPRHTPINARTTVVLTGFGPFPSVPVNATMLLVPRLTAAARLLFPGLQIIGDILETDWIAAPARVNALVKLHQPDLLLHFGVSGRARGFEIETRGHNVRAPAPDANGKRPNDAAVRTGGQQQLAARVPVAEIVMRLRARGIPAFRSWDAGTYLCNATLYHALTATNANACAAGFVHIPQRLAAPSSRLSATRTAPGCPLTWNQTLEGALEIIAACLDQPGPGPNKIAQVLQRIE